MGDATCNGRRFLVGIPVAAGLFASMQCMAADRIFQPVPQSKSQPVQAVNGLLIISAAGRSFDAGASFRPKSSRQAWLSVSVKNSSRDPIQFGDGGVQVYSQGVLLRISRVDLAGKPEAAPLTDPCANATADSQLNCNIDKFNQKQAARTSSVDAVEAQQLSPGQLVARQYQVELPKKSKGPARLTVNITAQGEQMAFQFSEVE